MDYVREGLPEIALTGSLDAILEKVSSQLRALLLIAVGVGSILVGVSLGRGLEFGRGSASLHWKRHIRIVSISRLLTTATGGARTLRMGTSTRRKGGLPNGPP